MMTGSKTNTMNHDEVLAAVRAIPAKQDFVWDGKTEDDRPAGTSTKEQVAIRLDHDILATFRASGRGWQTRMNDALRDWLKTHSSV